MASQTWASAVVTDSRTAISISAIDAYPQLTLILVAWTLAFWLARYLKSFFTRFIVTAVIVLLFASAFPIWFESASGSLQVLSPQIAKLTGISDWETQSGLLSQGYYNHFAADFFIILLVMALVAAIVSIWLPAKGQKLSSQFTTRIDNLPSW